MQRLKTNSKFAINRKADKPNCPTDTEKPATAGFSTLYSLLEAV